MKRVGSHFMKVIIFALALNVGVVCGRRKFRRYQNAEELEAPPTHDGRGTARTSVDGRQDFGLPEEFYKSASTYNGRHDGDWLTRKDQKASQRVACEENSDPCVNTTEPAVELTNRERLFLLSQSSHNSAVRPVRDDETTTVHLGMAITNILELNVRTQQLVMNVWLHQRWYNGLLRWDHEEFGGVKSIKIPSDKLWIPDIILFNSADDYREEIDYSRYRAECYSSGYHFWSLPTRLSSLCKIDVTYFPFDSQHCHLRFGSWMYKMSEINITSFEPGVDLTNFVASGEFELVTFLQKRQIKRYDAFFEGEAAEMVYYIHLRRNSLYYLYTMIIPCLLISTLTLLSFLLPPDSGEKIALGVTVLLAFSVFLMAVGDRLPETSDSVPLIGTYLTVVMGMTSVSVVMAALVILTESTATTGKRLPSFVRWLVLGKIRRLLCMKLAHRRGASLRQGPDTDYLIELLRSASGKGENVPPLPEDRLRRGADEPSDKAGGDENEWRKAARVIDRLLFWVFLVATVCVTLTFLVFIPFFARDPAVTDPDKLDNSLYGYAGRDD